MNHGGKIILHMSQLISLFAPRVPNCKPLDELKSLLDDRGRWHVAHALCEHVGHRRKHAGATGDQVTLRQCDFETACLKTIFNLTRPAAPFDPDSSYWIVPCALALAEQLNIDSSDITKIAANFS